MSTLNDTCTQATCDYRRAACNLSNKTWTVDNVGDFSAKPESVDNAPWLALRTAHAQWSNVNLWSFTNVHHLHLMHTCIGERAATRQFISGGAFILLCTRRTAASGTSPEHEPMYLKISSGTQTCAGINPAANVGSYTRLSSLPPDAHGRAWPLHEPAQLGCTKHGFCANNRLVLSRSPLATAQS